MGVGATHAQNFSPCIRQRPIVVAGGWCCPHSTEESHWVRVGSPVNRRRLRDQPGASTARSLGSGMEAWMELGKVPEEKEPAKEMAPGAVANFSPDCLLVSLEDMTLTSTQFPMATMAGAASGGFSR